MAPNLPIVALLTLLQGKGQPPPCAVSPDLRSASTVESPARLLNPELVRGRFAELTVHSRTATRDDSVVARSLGINVQVDSPASIIPSDNLIAFVVDTSGAVVRCSIRVHQPVADSTALFDVAARLRFSPARIAHRRVPQLFVARLLKLEDI